MADNPFQSLMNPNAARAGMYDMRMLSTANRMESPFEHRMPSYGHQGVGGNPMLSQIAGMGGQPDYSVFTTDPMAHAAAQREMAPYGVSPLEASQVQPNTILPNGGFFGRHPGLSGALEGGIYGALAAHGGATAGDSIQGALEGLVGGQRLKRGAYNQQFARPFEAANMLQNFEDHHQRRDLQEMEIQHYRAMNDKMKNAGDPKDFATFGTPNTTDEQVGVIDKTNGQIKWQPNPNFDPDLAKQLKRSSVPENHDLDIGTREQLRIMGKDPMTAQPADIAKANRLSQQQAIARGGSIAGATADARIPYQNFSDARAQHDRTIQAMQGKLLKSDDPAHQEYARKALTDEWMASAMRAAAAGQKAPPLKLPTDSDVKSYIDKQNQTTQSQIDQATDDFNTKWGPTAMEAPPVKKGQAKTAPRQTTGSSPSGPPKIGDVVDGYKFKGGDPSNQNSWSK